MSPNSWDFCLFWPCIVRVSAIALKMPKVRLLDKARTSNFTHQKFISLKVVVHILYAVERVFSKDLEPMLIVVS